MRCDLQYNIILTTPCMNLQKKIIKKFAMYSLVNKYNGYIRIFHQVTKERNLTSTIFEYYS